MVALAGAQAGDQPIRAMALPVRAVLQRLELARAEKGEPPSWASYLPRETLEAYLPAEVRRASYSDASVQELNLEAQIAEPTATRERAWPPAERHSRLNTYDPAQDFGGVQNPPFCLASVEWARQVAVPPEQTMVAERHAFAGRVYSMAKDRQGTHQVQEALQIVMAKGDVNCAVELARELETRVFEVSQCLHGNFVIQEIVKLLPANELGWLLEEVCPRKDPRTLKQLAKNKCSCRIISRLIEKCTEEQLDPLVRVLLEDFKSLCEHQYANYVMQNLVEFGKKEHRRLFLVLLQEHAHALTEDQYGSSVLAKAIACCPSEDAERLAKDIVRKGAFASFARSLSGSHPGRIAAKAIIPHFNDVEARELRHLQQHSVQHQQPQPQSLRRTSRGNWPGYSSRPSFGNKGRGSFHCTGGG